MADSARHPIGVFDSGVGGLSVLRALWHELPKEDFVYVADAGHAPYGEKDDQAVLARAQAVTIDLRDRYAIKALVVACNTATAAAIASLRASHPDIPIIGIEPAVKPALAQTRTGTVAVMATRSTLKSDKFRKLLQSLPEAKRVILQPCDGLADAIERNDAPKIEALCAEYTRAIGQFGIRTPACDTLVLGCTHYPFADSVLRRLCGPDVRFIEGGAPVAKRTVQVLDAHHLHQSDTQDAGRTVFQTTGNQAALVSAVGRWLGVKLDATASTLNQPVTPQSVGTGSEMV